MKISCVRENLTRALGSLSRIVTTSNTLPILGNILIKTDQGRLKLSATDLEMGINYWIGASVEEEGEITIPARIFHDYISNNSDEHIKLTVDGQQITLISDHYSTKINGLSPDEFPIIPSIKSESIIEIESSILQDAIAKVVFATSIGETNPALAGVLFKTDNSHLKIVATDSYRLAEKIIPLSVEITEDFAVIVPTKTAQELNRALQTVSPGRVHVIVSENQIMFKMDDIEIISRLIEGNYPAYESIMPVNFTTKAIIATKELLRDVKMAAVFSRDTQKIKLIVSQKNGQLTSLSKGQSGENVSTTTIEVEGIDGEIMFNTRYLSDVLNVVGSSKIILELTDKLKPGLIKSTDDDHYKYIIMPVKD
jgi:DNA polymerase-3 subunit beta